MLFVEDVLALVAARPQQAGAPASDWDRDFIASVHQQAGSGRPLSTRQSEILLRIVARRRAALIDEGLVSAPALDALLARPRHRLAPYASTVVPKEVRHLGANRLAFRFKYNQAVMKDLRSAGAACGAPPAFDRAHRLWVVCVTAANLASIQGVIRVHRIGMDDATADYLSLCRNSAGQPSAMVLDEESGLVVGNVCDNDIFSQWVVHVAGGEYL